MPAQFDDFKAQFDRLIESSEAFAIATVKISERMIGINDRLSRIEDVQEELIQQCRDASLAVSRKESCPYSEVIIRLKSDVIDNKKIGDVDIVKLANFIENDHANLIVKVSSLSTKLNIIGAVSITALSGATYAIIQMIVKAMH